MSTAAAGSTQTRVPQKKKKATAFMPLVRGVMGREHHFTNRPGFGIGRDVDAK